ncbi:U6 snRNA phosphodiesterase [Hyposmocoma kahamanoa]|uniref:U6 snRNA phosphodiesterase n=1 Tax=Hyposmocoma kahamanoa TaxID=1477025 RepID=UPI000E6D6FB1|nr:U6 snRNA phosphodiesterase [Hyposmocoma kahamanoa]
MSALSYICGYGYGSNSDDSDCEIVPRGYKRPKLPTPDLSKVTVIPVCEEHLDDPKQHDGRTRTFPHVRGNWATFVYIKYSDEEGLFELVNNLQSAVVKILDKEPCQRCEDFHISLSKTAVLKYHFISPFTTSLQEALTGLKRINLSFDSVKVYCNDENTRTFIALKVDYSSNKSLQEITSKVDEILDECSLPTFYEDPSFHMSILWVNGNKKRELEDIVENLNDIVAQEIGKSLQNVIVNRVHCRSGNKLFQFSLQ